MSICVPIKELKDTASFTNKVQSASGPVIVTKNGHEAFVSMSMEAFESLKLEAARARLYQAVDRAECDIKNGYVTPAAETISQLKNRNGI